MRRGRRDAQSGVRGALARALPLLALLACAPEGAEGDYALFRHLELADELVIGAADGWARETAERMVPRLEAELGKRVVVRDPSQARAGARRARLLLGYADTPALQPALERLGVVSDEATTVRLGGFDFGGREGGALVATLPDPQHGDAPLTILVALEAHDAVGWAHVDLDVARELRPTWHTGWQVWGGTGLLLAQGRLGPEGEAAFTAEPVHPDLLTRTALDWGREDGELAGIEQARRVALERVLNVLGPAATLEDFEPRVRLHRRAEDLALSTRAWRSYRCAPASGVVDLVVAPGLHVDAHAAFAELFALRAGRMPQEAWLVDALVRYVARSWWGQDLEPWCAHLARASLVPSLEELVSPAPQTSPHVVTPLRGLLLEVLLATRGTDEVRRLWRDGGLAIDEPLRRAFAERLERLVATHGDELESRLTARRAQVLARPFRRGVALVGALGPHDPLDSGLGSRAGAESLGRIAALGADAVSIDVASWLERPWSAFALEPRAAPGAQAADLELAAACAAAAALDLDVLLKPSLWLAPVSSLAGQTLVNTANEWRRFFDGFQRHLVHYALLSELVGVEVLSVGSEMRNAAVTFRERGDPNWGADHYEWKRSRWEAALTATRAAFGGGLTYAARWDEPLDAFSFWDQLDFVGLDLFAPLAQAPGPDSPPRLQDIARGLRRALESAEMDAAVLGKRLLVVEIGFPSAHESWQEPSRPRGSVDERAQALFLGALAAQRRTWTQRQSGIAGLFVWCWSAEPDGGASWERGYTLQGKRGESALERVFREP